MIKNRLLTDKYSGHQAFLTEEALLNIAQTTIQNLKDLEEKGECQNECKPEKKGDKGGKKEEKADEKGGQIEN